MKHFVCALFVLVSIPAFAEDHSTFEAGSVDDSHLTGFYCAGGLPENADEERPVTILVNHGYVTGYSPERKNPVWGAYVASDIKNGDPEYAERPDFFQPDPRVPEPVSPQTFGNDLDRGHMVPNAAIARQYGSLAQMETFFMTNMCPQHKNLNQQSWQRLEKYVLDVSNETNRKHVYVIAGPVFGSEDSERVVLEGRGVEVPAAFYMILLDTDYEWTPNPKLEPLAFWFDQGTPPDADFADHLTSIERIQDATGLNFFPEFDARFSSWAAKEAATATEVWPLNEE